MIALVSHLHDRLWDRHGNRCPRCSLGIACRTGKGYSDRARALREMSRA